MRVICLIVCLLPALACQAGSPSAKPDQAALLRQLEPLRQGLLDIEGQRRLIAELSASLPPGASAERRWLTRYRCWVGEQDSSRDPDAEAAELANWLAEAERAKDKQAEADFRLCAASRTYQMSHYAEAERHLQAGLSAAHRLADIGLLAKGYAVLGELRSVQGLLREALEALENAQRLFEQADMPGHALYNRATLGNTYRRLGDFERALNYYEPLGAAFERNGQRAYQAQVLLETGQVYADQGRYTEAINAYRQAQNTYQRLGVSTEAKLANLSLISALQKNGENEEALRLAAELKPLLRSIKDDYGLRLLSLDEAAAQLALKRPAEALATLAPLLKTVDKELNPQRQARLWQIQAKAQAELHRWSEALDSYQRFNIAHRAAQKQQLERDELRYRLRNKSADIEEEHRRLQQEDTLRKQTLAQLQDSQAWQKTALLMGAALLVLLTVFGVRLLGKARLWSLLASTDELTGLANRRQIEQLAREALQGSESRAFSIVLFDIDHFKKINDVYGHACGDRVLQQVARASADALREQDEVGRVGGEEFLVFLIDANEAAALIVAERLRKAIANLRFDEAEALRVTISLGIACRREEQRLDALVARADAALYRAKNAGRDQVALG